MASKKLTEYAPGKAYGYIRASTEEQEVSVAAQKSQIEYAFDTKYKASGYTWGGLYIDQGVSGGVELARRAQGYQLCLDMKPGDLVIFQKIDRGWRSLRDCLNSMHIWKERGVRVAFVTMDIDTATFTGEMQLQLMAMVAQFERAMMSERMKHCKAQLRKQGKPWTNKAPYGFKIEGSKGKRFFVPYPEQRALTSKFIEWIDMGYTYGQILDFCKAKGVVNPTTGNPINSELIYIWTASERHLRKVEIKCHQDGMEVNPAMLPSALEIRSGKHASRVMHMTGKFKGVKAQKRKAKECTNSLGDSDEDEDQSSECSETSSMPSVPHQ